MSADGFLSLLSAAKVLPYSDGFTFIANFDHFDLRYQ